MPYNVISKTTFRIQSEHTLFKNVFSILMVSVAQELVGLLHQFCKHRVCPTWVGVNHFNNNNST